MTTESRAPKVVKGAIVGVDILNPLASVVIFQYNPETVRRQLAVNAGGGDGQAEPYRLVGPPRETIDVRVEIDAADQLEAGDALAETVGVHPQLAALEMLAYPKSALVIANSILAATGTIEVVPPLPSMTLFIWGLARVVPVKIQSFSIEETIHDGNLNPIQANVDLSMQVLNYNDFGLKHPGYYVFMAHQAAKEAMAVIGSVANVAANV